MAPKDEEEDCDIPPKTMNTLLSERSMKFYDGTYKWNTDGFEDEAGVYHAWDDETTELAPTPNPPRFSDLEDDARKMREDSFHSDVVTVHHGPLTATVVQPHLTDQSSHLYRNFSPLVSNPSFLKHAAPTNLPRRGQENEYLYSKTELREDLFQDESEGLRQRLIGRLEGIHIGQWYASTGLSLEEAYKLVGVNYPDEIVKTATRRQSKVSSAPALSTSRYSPIHAAANGTGGGDVSSRSSSSSFLSDPPSNIDDMEPPTSPMCSQLQFQQADEASHGAAENNDNTQLPRNRGVIGQQATEEAHSMSQENDPEEVYMPDIPTKAQRGNKRNQGLDSGSDSEYEPEKKKIKGKKQQKKRMLTMGSMEVEMDATNGDAMDRKATFMASNGTASIRRRSLRTSNQKK